MVEKTKITLSNKEQELVANTDWILTKYSIIQKVYSLFGELLVPMQQLIAYEKAVLPPEVNSNYPKISKGENYKGLPYVMLDYPRCFEKENILAVRTFFWWGNFFSINLQLSGKHKVAAMPALLHNFSMLRESGYAICVSADPWQHHFDDDNYVSFKNYTAANFRELLDSKDFIKIAKSIPVQQWSEVPLFLEQSFKEMIVLLRS
ncbi:MAG TPA: hypothetical protein VK718_10890 [Ferruginibacter sp.]|jgi:hypothetical protein|nr:hypothetical protein [Ferruginibacter sp.]